MEGKLSRILDAIADELNQNVEQEVINLTNDLHTDMM
jgi:type II secretory pathway component PulF